ncbi:hypothetical protein GOV13_00875 [Candidatus Pacearchaeota archaeon]|nr:hypothetical protein [Candidatus Pacearchaeota archaeon]
MKNKYLIQTGIIITILILFISCISAFGIGSAYYKENPLKLSAGETKDVKFNLQNMAGSEGIIAKASISQGAEIMGLIDPQETYSIPLGGSLDVMASVSIPTNAKSGDTYPVKITFTTVTESDSGVFGFGGSVGREFDVIVIPTTEESARLAAQKNIPWNYIIIGLIALIILITYIIWKKRDSKKN